MSCVPNVASVSGLFIHNTPFRLFVWLFSSCVVCTQCCQYLWIVVVLCLVYPMLPVSLDCPFLIPLPFSIMFICLFVFVLCRVYPMLPVSLDCLRPVTCVPNVASISGLSSSCILCAQCCQYVWIVFVLCLVCPMLPVSLDCPFLIPPSVFSNVYLVFSLGSCSNISMMPCVSSIMLS